MVMAAEQDGIKQAELLAFLHRVDVKPIYKTYASELCSRMAREGDKRKERGFRLSASLYGGTDTGEHPPPEASFSDVDGSDGDSENSRGFLNTSPLPDGQVRTPHTKVKEPKETDRSKRRKARPRVES
eukprot:GHVR01034926.1.p1 GENE.GHVR01034926.1~~GHVR01034926.1.p1  ORF type:complete len:128 (-),score=22.84 GHVR01034926.1:407-790(-)